VTCKTWVHPCRLFLLPRGGGFGAVIIGGASVIRVIGGATLCSSISSYTLCSMAVAGGTYGCFWMSPLGSIHWWAGAVIVRASWSRLLVSILFMILVRTRAFLFGYISCNVVTSSSTTSCKCSFQSKKGTWQCSGNNSVDPDIRYALVSGTK
jgi:hypothetical protein